MSAAERRPAHRLSRRPLVTEVRLSNPALPVRHQDRPNPPVGRVLVAWLQQAARVRPEDAADDTAAPAPSTVHATNERG